MKVPDLRNLEVTTKTGSHVCDTNQLRGEANDSLTGSNVLKQYTTSGDSAPGKTGGMPTYGSGN